MAWLRLAAFLMALAGHGAILLWLTRGPPDSRAGAHGQMMASVDVAMIDSTILEARKVDTKHPPAPAASKTVDAKEGVPDGELAPHTAEDKERPEKKAAQERRPDNEATQAKAINDAKEMPEHKRAKATEAVPLGGFSARTDTVATAEQAAPAAASPGAVQAYANAVAEVLKQTKLKRVPAFGTVKVKLVVALDGGIASLEILESSGNARLDDAVLAAIRRVKLPVPPPGMAPEQRWYEFTYRYRR